MRHEEQVKESTLEDLLKESMVKESSSNMIEEEKAAENPVSEQQNSYSNNIDQSCQHTYHLTI